MDIQINMEQSEYNLDRQIGYLLRLAHQRHSMIFQQNMLSALTPTQFSALIRISKEKSCSQNHLGRMISVDVATIKGVVDRLRKKKLVNSSEDPNDKRRTLISLTPKAEAMIGDLQETGTKVSKETLRPLTMTERNRLVQLLKKIT